MGPSTLSRDPCDGKGSGTAQTQRVSGFPEFGETCASPVPNRSFPRLRRRLRALVLWREPDQGPCTLTRGSDRSSWVGMGPVGKCHWITAKNAKSLTLGGW